MLSTSVTDPDVIEKEFSRLLAEVLQDTGKHVAEGIHAGTLGFRCLKEFPVSVLAGKIAMVMEQTLEHPEWKIGESARRVFPSLTLPSVTRLFGLRRGGAAWAILALNAKKSGLDDHVGPMIDKLLEALGCVQQADDEKDEEAA